MTDAALFSKETYLELLHDLQAFSAVQLVGFCIANDLEFSSIPIPSVIYVSKIDIEDKLTPLAYLEVESDNPKIVCMRFEGDEPSYASFGFLEFLDNYTTLTSESHTKLSIVSQPTNTKS